ncbi:hypothetical protein LTR05_006072 [Lithohypha guttulata]|uniref:Protein-tyrosine-phosphatase n=1 Tax=Lithohypha guttulata TaxID=1690604 RepID=A0AAN7YEP2_9EURO|nr:hypothetical protein LTR05_006072 [Lithohypha guttulata]
MTTVLGSRSKFLQKSKSSNPVVQRYLPTPSTPIIPDMIIPNLYLCDMGTARGVLLPTYPGQGRPVIRYVLSVLDNSISQPKPKPVNMDKFVQKLIIMDDTIDANLLPKLGEACDWIDEMMSKADGGVLVHCQLGQSRSASVVIAYLMRKQNMDYQTALSKVKYRRSIVRPNPGFQTQLQMWHQMGCDIFEPDPQTTGQLRQKEQYSQWKEEQRLRIHKSMTF